MFGSAAGLCYFVACMTLQDCQQYRQSMLSALPARSSVDAFYWMNHEDATPCANDYSLIDLVQNTPELTHWRLLSPEARSWLPIYHYSRADASQCSGYVHLDLGFLLRPDTNYGKLLNNLVETAHGEAAALVNLEPACSPDSEYSLNSGSLLLDLSALQRLLAGFQKAAVDAGTIQYQPYDFAEYFSTNMWLAGFTVLDSDQTYCAVASTAAALEPLPEKALFVRLSGSAGIEEPIELAGLVKAGAGGRAPVF
jgi:hypothetical protein